MIQPKVAGPIIQLAVALLVPAGIIASSMLFIQLWSVWSIDDASAVGLAYLGGCSAGLALILGTIIGATWSPNRAKAFADRAGNKVNPILIGVILNAVGGLLFGAIIWLGAATITLWIPALIERASP